MDVSLKQALSSETVSQETGHVRCHTPVIVEAGR